jgi:hypothetical protein
MTGLFLTATLVRLATDRSGYEAELAKTIESSKQFRDLGLVADDLWVPALVMIGLLAVWCVAAYALTFAVLRRADWARIVLLVSAGFAAAMSLIGIITIVSVFPLVASGLTIRLLLVRESSEWFAWKPFGPR